MALLRSNDVTPSDIGDAFFQSSPIFHLTEMDTAKCHKKVEGRCVAKKAGKRLSTKVVGSEFAEWEHHTSLTLAGFGVSPATQEKRKKKKKKGRHFRFHDLRTATAGHAHPSLHAPMGTIGDPLLVRWMQVFPVLR